MSIIKIFDQTVPYVSGYSMRSRYITDSLSELGVDVNVFSSPIFSYEGERETIKKAHYHRSRVTGWNCLKKIPLLKECAIVNSIKSTMNKDWNGGNHLIHAHSSLLNAMAGLDVAKRHKVPFIYEVRALWEDAAVDQGKTTEGSLRYNVTRNFETKILKQADRVTVICEGLKKDIEERGIDAKKITVVPNGVDTEKFVPLKRDDQLAKELGLSGKKVIGFIGTFFLFEGLSLLVQAANEILKQRSDVKFVIVGGGREEEAIKNMVNGLGLTDDVILTGRVKHDDVKKYYSIMDILVYPRISKRITELVTPLKPLEAMALEKTVIGSDVGGIKELVDDGRTGLLFKAGDVDDLVKKCVYAVSNEQEMKKIAKQSREYVVRERNWLNISKRYLDIYKDLGVKV